MDGTSMCGIKPLNILIKYANTSAIAIAKIQGIMLERKISYLKRNHIGVCKKFEHFRSCLGLLAIKF